LLILRTLPIAVLAASFCAAALPAPPAQTTAAHSMPSGAAPSLPNAPADKLKLTGVPNAAQISDALSRGAQPSAQGFAELKKLGVTTIVNLREQGQEVEWERKVAESLGIRYVNIPVRGWLSPSDAQVAQFLKLFHEAPGQRVFVHCQYGEDRTGVMVATYRIAQQNWTVDQAVNEMYAFGFHYYLYPAMQSYVREFPANFAVESVFSSLHVVPAQIPAAKQP
jgi:tyrosine-protein phosphatase SIW14